MDQYIDFKSALSSLYSILSTEFVLSSNVNGLILRKKFDLVHTKSPTIQVILKGKSVTGRSDLIRIEVAHIHRLEYGCSLKDLDEPLKLMIGRDQLSKISSPISVNLAVIYQQTILVVSINLGYHFDISSENLESSIAEIAERIRDVNNVISAVSK